MALPIVTLASLRKRYEKRYIHPLRFHFSRPPELFNDFQIRLFKQIDSELERLGQSEICQDCNGRGSSRKLTPIQPDPMYCMDERSLDDSVCMTCGGHGLVFPVKKSIRTGDEVHARDLESVKCRSCGKELSVDVRVWQENLDDVPLVEYHASCCKIEYVFRPQWLKANVDRTV